MVYGIESIEFTNDNADPLLVDYMTVSSFVAPNSWVLHNSFIKSLALWREMQALVLGDNPSIVGRWHDYKVFLDGPHREQVNGVGPVGNLNPMDSTLTPYKEGEWNYATFVMPQHSVDAAGNPLPADETNAHLVGPDLGAAGAFKSVGLIQAYSQSRATVQPEDPYVPGGMSTSFFNLLTDSGSQEPELADVIEGENDEPPYDQNEYPGGSSNAPYPVIGDFGTSSAGMPVGILTPFIAPCGVILLKANSFKAGDAGPTIPVLCKVTVAVGHYNGVAAIPMGQ